MKNFSLRAGRFLTLALLLTGLGLSSCKKDDTSTTSVAGNWTRNGVGTFSGPQRAEAVSFIINGVAYAGTGRNATNVLNDFYAFDPAARGWASVTPMPAAAGNRYGAVAFTVNNRGYVGGGNNGSGATNAYLSDFWEFNPSQTTTTTTTITNPTTGFITTNTTTTTGVWREVASLPVALYGAVAGSINNLGLVGCGFDGSNNRNDFYQFDGTKWTPLAQLTQRAPFPGSRRTGAFSFVLNNQFYVAGGTNNNLAVTDVYAYDPSTSQWSAPKRSLLNVSNSTESYDYSGVARAQGVGFAVNGKGYVTTGGSTLLSCYEYDPAADTWTLKNPFTGAARNNAVGFGIGDYGYVGLGVNGSTRLDDFYRFDPNAAQE